MIKVTGSAILVGMADYPIYPTMGQADPKKSKKKKGRDWITIIMVAIGAIGAVWGFYRLAFAIEEEQLQTVCSQSWVGTPVRELRTSA